MKGTGDKVVDTVLANFRSVASPIIRKGHGVDVEDCLERAISGARFDLRKEGYSERSIRERIWPVEDDILLKCRKIVLEIEKRSSLLDIRKTSVAAILDDWSENSGLVISYKLRDNSSVGFAVKVPATGQYLKFNVSYSKILSEEWRDGLLGDIHEFFALSERLGRIRLSPTGSL